MSATQPSVFDIVVLILTSERFIAAFLGLIGGVIATFIAPWTKWIFEKRKIQFDNRKDKVRHWREEINKYNDYISFTQSSTFRDLKHRLTKEELHLFGGPGLYIDLTANPEKSKLARFYEIVSEIEKEWRII